MPLWPANEIGAADPRAIADAVIEMGDVPSELDPPFSTLADYQIAGARILLRAPSVARFLINSGRNIRIQLMPRADVRAVLRYLLGSAMAALFHQRQLFALQASVVMKDGACFAFLGAARTGKSVLAQALAARNYSILADDILLISAGGKMLRTRRETIPRTFTAQRILGPRNVYILRWLLPKSAEPELTPISAFDAMVDLRKVVCRAGLIAAMNREPAFLSFASQLLASADAFEFKRPMCLKRLTVQVDALERHFFQA